MSCACSWWPRPTLPTRYGTFTLYGFFDSRDEKEHTAIVQGDVADKERVPVRVHSECHTGDVWGSLRCDCRDQLEAATRYVSQQPFGAVIYLKQEGRGIGLLNKIKAYQLQDLGLDTVEANQYLDMPVDARDYKVAARIIQLLKIRSVSLLTNNPDKIEQLKARRDRCREQNPHRDPRQPLRRGLPGREEAQDGAPHLKSGMAKEAEARDGLRAERVLPYGRKADSARPKATLRRVWEARLPPFDPLHGLFDLFPVVEGADPHEAFAAAAETAARA